MDDTQNLIELIGKEKFQCFLEIREYIETHYDLQQTLKEQNVKTKKWKYEYKFSKGSKTFCGFYFAEDCLGFMIIFGKEERDKVDQIKEQLSSSLVQKYDETKNYHDGKWLMLELDDLTWFEDIKKLLAIKRKPQKK